jgi:Divergent InlB B-repeat domain
MTLTVVSNHSKAGSASCQRASDGWATHLGDNVTINADQYDNVTVTAVASQGYRFVKWTGDTSGVGDVTQSTIIVPMDRYYPDMKLIELTARFQKTDHSPWAWLTVGVVALLVAALAVAVLLQKKRNHPADAQPP